MIHAVSIRHWLGHVWFNLIWNIEGIIEDAHVKSLSHLYLVVICLKGFVAIHHS